MSDKTTNLSLPYIMPSQAQKHVTHNEAIRALDALVQMAVIDVDRTALPADAAEGDAYILSASPDAGWQASAQALVAFQDGAWAAYTPKAGWTCYNQADKTFYIFDGSHWFTAARPDSVTTLGINASADMAQRLVVQSTNALFSHDPTNDSDGSVRVKLNRQSNADIASVVFQSGYSGQYELGAAGSKVFALRYSSNDADWFNALSIDHANGHVSFGDEQDFTRLVNLQDSAPWLRFSNVSETETGLEFVDAQAPDSQNMSFGYHCASNTGFLRLNGADLLKFTDVELSVETPFRSQATIAGKHVYASSRVFIANNGSAGNDAESADPTTATNLDHIWNDDGTNTWHFCSDAAYKSQGNATLQAAAFVTPSDRRLKGRISSIDPQDAANQIMAMAPSSFRWNALAGPALAGRDALGFIADELSAVAPLLVHGDKNETDENTGKAKYQSVDYSAAVPLLVAAMQWIISETKNK